MKAKQKENEPEVAAPSLAPDEIPVFCNCSATLSASLPLASAHEIIQFQEKPIYKLNSGVMIGNANYDSYVEFEIEERKRPLRRSGYN